MTQKKYNKIINLIQEHKRCEKTKYGFGCDVVNNCGYKNYVLYDKEKIKQILK